MKEIALFLLFISHMLYSAMAHANSSFHELPQLEYHGFTDVELREYSAYLHAFEKQVDTSQGQTTERELVFILGKISEKLSLDVTIYVNKDEIILFNQSTQKDANQTW